MWQAACAFLRASQRLFHAAFLTCPLTSHLFWSLTMMSVATPPDKATLLKRKTSVVFSTPMQVISSSSTMPTYASERDTGSDNVDEDDTMNVSGSANTDTANATRRVLRPRQKGTPQQSPKQEPNLLPKTPTQKKPEWNSDIGFARPPPKIHGISPRVWKPGTPHPTRTSGPVNQLRGLDIPEDDIDNVYIPSVRKKHVSKPVAGSPIEVVEDAVGSPTPYKLEGIVREQAATIKKLVMQLEETQKRVTQVETEMDELRCMVVAIATATAEPLDKNQTCVDTINAAGAKASPVSMSPATSAKSKIAMLNRTPVKDAHDPVSVLDLASLSLNGKSRTIR